MEKVVLSRVSHGMKVYLNRELQERLNVKSGDLLAWEFLNGGEVRVYKPRITRETG